MPAVDLKQQIEQALAAFTSQPLGEAALGLFRVLGYESTRRMQVGSATAAGFLAVVDARGSLDRERALVGDWRTVEFLFQLTDAEIQSAGGQLSLFDSQGAYDGAIMESYVFLAVELRRPPERTGARAGRAYTRTELAQITRAVNRLFPMPAMVLFRHGDTLTFAVIDRRLNKLDETRDVLEKVTVIKDIRAFNPHRAHVEILHDLALRELHRTRGFTSFAEMHKAWRATFDIQELNKRFFQELSNWYFWALGNVTFPHDAPKDDGRDAVSVIRLITRLIFAWFLREKGELIPDALFSEQQVMRLLGQSSLESDETIYYKAILQNLFFATLNQEPGQRGFRKDGQNFMAHNLYRYRRLLADPGEALRLFDAIPFLNGGLFECLDSVEELADGSRRYIRIDGFSDRDDNPLSVPDFLFFGAERDVDLNEAYGTSAKRYRARGIIHTLERFKFTVAENTPVEEEVALDPELLGRVFENLLAAYNPDTGKTARKLTGSFYTPREIVDYMVQEALIAELTGKLAKQFPSTAEHAARLRALMAWDDAPSPFGPQETAFLIAALDSLRVVDPACGSGAFPMGILHKLVHALGKLDPHNREWKGRQIAKAAEIPDSDAREKAIAAIEDAFTENELDYGRKLYLIENCIYGVDIQPIACQIAKLRFFISLVVEQKVRPLAPNRGIRPLPNLETKIIAANSLLPVDRRVRQVGDLFSDNFEFLRQVNGIRDELVQIRHAHFLAKTPSTKAKYRELDKAKRQEIAALLRQHKTPAPLARLLASWDPYDQNGHAEFFDPEWMFNVRDGFDITIGNPPYVRADSGSNYLGFRRQLEDCGQYQTLWEKWDLFVPFMELGFRLLRPGGVTTMIVSDAFCHAKYAQKPQEWFLKNSRILRLDFLSDLRVFDAAVHNLVYFFQKADGAANCPERRRHTGEFGQVTVLATDVQRNLTARAFFPEDANQKAYSVPSVTVDEICYISKGMVVHANEKVAQGAFQLSDLVADQADAEHPKPFVEGKHLDRWLPTTHKWLEWGTSRAPGLFSRPTFAELYEVPEKILILRVGGKDLRSCYDGSQFLCNHTVMVAVRWHSLRGVRNNSLRKAARYADEKPPRLDLPRREDLEATSRRFAVKYLLAVMNSAVARDFLRAHRRSNTDLYPDDWKALPMPDVDSTAQAPVVALVDRIMAARRADPDADITELEAELDARVARLYGLDEEALDQVLRDGSEAHRLAARALFRDLAREEQT